MSGIQIVSQVMWLNLLNTGHPYCLGFRCLVFRWLLYLGIKYLRIEYFNFVVIVTKNNLFLLGSEIIFKLKLHSPDFAGFGHQVIAKVIGDGGQPHVPSVAGVAFVVEPRTRQPDSVSRLNLLSVDEWNCGLHCLETKWRKYFFLLFLLNDFVVGFLGSVEKSFLYVGYYLRYRVFFLVFLWSFYLP